jgi:hypothetical protein
LYELNLEKQCRLFSVIECPVHYMSRFAAVKVCEDELRLDLLQEYDTQKDVLE